MVTNRHTLSTNSLLQGLLLTNYWPHRLRVNPNLANYNITAKTAADEIKNSVYI
jgi:hypothetical protein